MVSSDLQEDLRRVLALTREIANYAEDISRALGCPEGDVWGVYLAATGRMRYPEQQESEELFLDGEVRAGGPTRYTVWLSALLRVLDILGPVEARLRTGYEEVELRSAVARFFEGRGGSNSDGERRTP